ncbi:MAG: DNA repair protein RadC [Bdellovibrionales bacterium]|jgi:DNA repair protein RadC
MAKQKPMSTEDGPHYLGHRQRLRDRFLRSGAEALQDYELLEILLFAAVPRRDVKPLAKKLLTEFKSLWVLVNAPAERLVQSGLSENAAATVLVSGALALRAQKKEIVGGTLLNNWQRMIDYCRLAMAHESVEQVRLLFLDRKNRLLSDEVQQRGTIDHTPVYPREIVKRALEMGAGALVLVHNHPSGDPAPSKEDIAMTRAVVAACCPLGIVVHDHIIIGRDEVVSLKNLGLL